MKRILLLVVLCSPAVVVCQQNAVLKKSLDSVFLRNKAAGIPGCACAVVQKGEVIYKNAFGRADIKQQVPITTGTIMGIGSVSKHFTAYALLLLQQQGKLSLNDPVTRYVPLPFLHDTIRIYHLLTHTAGFHESNSLFDILYGDPERMRSMGVIDTFVRNHRLLEFTPGTRYSYNNSGYSLAAFIVEKVSGESFPQFMRNHVFQPLHMNNSQVITDHTIDVPGLAAPYKMKASGDFIIDSLKHNFYGFTGVFTTVSDLIKWDAWLTSLEEKDNSLYRELTMPRYLKNGKPLYYGYGLQVVNYHGYKVIAHSGRDNGYTAYYVRFPEPELSLIAICNNRQGIPWDMCYAMANKILPAKNNAARVNASAATTPVAKQTINPEQYTGLFWSPQKKFERDAVIKTEARGDDLFMISGGRSRQMQPLERGQFKPVNTGEVWKYNQGNFIVSADNDTTAVYYPVQPYRGEASLPLLEGSYRSDELGITVTIQQEGQQLILHHPNMGKLQLLPLFHKGFTSKFGILVWDTVNNDRFRLLYEDITRLYFYRVE